MNTSTQNTEKLDLNELKKRREQQKLTVQTVADGMKVSKDFVQYIEAGEFEKLGAPTFVRGHITNYCKVLGIEPGSVLTQIPSDLLQHQQLKTSDALGSSPLSLVRHQSNHYGRYAVGTALLVMLCMSFYFIWDKWSLTSDIQNPEGVNISQENTDADGEKKITYSSLIPQVSGPNFKDASNNNLSLDQVTEDVSLQGDKSEHTTSNEPTSTTSGSNNGSTVYSIVMEVEDQAWVSIKTLDGDFIIQDLLGPGLREFQVTEPVHFRIGNAKNMQLSINDDTIELAPLTSRDIADFKWPLEPSF